MWAKKQKIEPTKIYIQEYEQKLVRISGTKTRTNELILINPKIE